MYLKIVMFTFDDEIRLKRIVIDRDRDDALELAKELPGRISASSNRRLQNHLDTGYHAILRDMHNMYRGKYKHQKH
jgi:hypothetical protein